MLILGVDASLNKTGWALINQNGQKFSCESSGIIVTPKENPFAFDQDHLKLYNIYHELSRIIKLYKPIEAAIETTFVNNNARTSLLLGQARGVALFALVNHKLPVLELSPAEIKKAITGNGRADKDAVSKNLKFFIDNTFKHNDESDAAAIAITALLTRKFKMMIKNN